METNQHSLNTYNMRQYFITIWHDYIDFWKAKYNSGNFKRKIALADELFKSDGKQRHVIRLGDGRLRVLSRNEIRVLCKLGVFTRELDYRDICKMSKYSTPAKVTHGTINNIYK